MAQYINKSALVAEIKRRQKIHFNDYHINGNNSPADYGACNALTQILAFIDTLEVKEVDINNEISQFIDTNFEKATIGHKLSLRRVARHFFELGLKAKGE